jgi:amino acid adenylation domain-containing protein
MHHIISDGWSLEVLTSEIIEAYALLASGQALAMPELPVQFKDYAAWLAQSKLDDAQQQAKEYWLNAFGGDLPVLALPCFTKRPLLKTYSGAAVSYSFPKKKLAQLKSFSKKHQVTLFMTLMSGVKTLLSRYSNQQDIIVGTPVAGRDHQDLESQIGLYINTLPIRTSIQEQDTFIDLLQREKQILLQAYSHQNYSLDQLLGELNLTRDHSRSPLFDVMVVLQNQRQVARFQNRESIKGLQISDFPIQTETAQFDMAFVFVEDDNLTLNVSYNPDIYEKSFVERLFTHLANLFNQVMVTPEVKLEAIDLLSSGEKHQLLSQFNNNQVQYPSDKTLIDLFTGQANNSPQAPAIAFGGKSMSYRELDVLSNRLANYLLSRFDIAAEELIGVVLERSEWSVISFLAVLKAGGAYVPIDPNYPQPRIAYIIDDSKCKIIIDDALVREFLMEENGSPLAPQVRVRAGNLAYVVYTSGSTGNPKGVLIEHKGIVNTILAAIDGLDGSAHKKGLQYASFCFDASVFEVFVTLLSGSCLYIANEMERRDPGLLGAFIAGNEIDLAVIFPAYLKLLDVDQLRSLKTLVTAGEAAAYEKTLEYLRHGTTVFNAYGPTEVSVCNTLFRITRENVAASNNIPIGSPLPNTQAYVCSDAHSLQPVGVIGEICVAGAGLARGYLNRPELTSQKFIPHPYAAGERLYKTGDLGRWLPGGVIEFVGRKDDQVKVRGHRIEPGEIESALLKSDRVDNAVVLVKQNPDGENELVACIISPVRQNAADLRAQLRHFLPDYMIPSQFVQVDEFPFTASGKVDKKALSALPGENLLNSFSYVAPRNQIEERLTLIWEEVLGARNIGVMDDFFNAGGHSLKAVAMLSKVNRAFGINLNFALIFELRCVAELAVLIGNLLWDKEQVKEIQVVEKVTI